MAEFRGLTHQIARVLLLALCMSLFAATLSLFNPDPALARPGHIAASAGDLGGALESKPDQWGAPDQTLVPLTLTAARPLSSPETLWGLLCTLVSQLLDGWI